MGEDQAENLLIREKENIQKIDRLFQADLLLAIKINGYMVVSVIN